MEQNASAAISRTSFSTNITHAHEPLALQAPYVPPTPDLSASWHMHPMPEQHKFPDLTIASPPLHLLHDNRFPKIATN
jgi:hypothetical protein